MGPHNAGGGLDELEREPGRVLGAEPTVPRGAVAATWMITWPSMEPTANGYPSASRRTTGQPRPVPGTKLTVPPGGVLRPSRRRRPGARGAPGPRHAVVAVRRHWSPLPHLEVCRELGLALRAQPRDEGPGEVADVLRVLMRGRHGPGRPGQLQPPTVQLAALLRRSRAAPSALAEACAISSAHRTAPRITEAAMTTCQRRTRALSRKMSAGQVPGDNSWPGCRATTAARACHGPPRAPLGQVFTVPGIPVGLPVP